MSLTPAKFEKTRAAIALIEALVRPVLTLVIAAVFNGGAIWLVSHGKITPMEFLNAIGPANMLILGFWFGERAAQKAFHVNPPKDD